MKERGISMTHEMNLAYLADKKNTTRRLSGLHSVNMNPGDWEFMGLKDQPNHLDQAVALFGHVDKDTQVIEIPCPYGRIGTVLWIKEAHWHEPKYPGARLDSPHRHIMRPIYKADKQPHVAKIMKWRPGRVMPRIYARSFAEIIELRAERLQDITDVGAIDEGMLTLGDDWIEKNFPDYFKAWREWSIRQDAMEVKPPLGPSPRERFAKTIDIVNKDGIWDENLWCWVIKFQRLKNYSNDKSANI